MLHASLTAFSTTRPVSLRYLGDVSTVTDGDDTEALEFIDDQIDGLRPVAHRTSRAG
jgi:hypothetical protein